MIQFLLMHFTSGKGCLAVQGVKVAIENNQIRIYALQYHPEVQHSVRGNEVLKRFLFAIANVSQDWKMENVLDEELAKLRAVVISFFRCSILPTNMPGSHV